MNSEERTIRDRHPLLSYEQRFVSGKVISYDQGIVHFRLEASSVNVTPSPQWARVRKEHLLSETQMADYPLHSTYQVFLLGPTTKDPNLWHASLAWADPDNNPWSDNSPYRLISGNEVSGTVTHFAGETFAIVTLDDSGIEAFLHWENIPAGRRPIASVLHVGDRILAVVSTADPERLMVHLSVNEAVDNAKRHFHNLRQKHDLRQKMEGQDSYTGSHTEFAPLEVQPFAGLRVLVVEHDRIFAEHLLDLLKGLCADVVQADNPQHVVQLLRGNASFSHILCDYLMGNSAQRRELHDLVPRFKVPVALMSGEYADAQSVAREKNWAFLPKPIAYADLYNWLVHGQVPVPMQEETTLSQTWGLGLESKAYLKRAQSAIEAFCQRISAVGAFWVRRRREGVYAVLAAYGLDNQHLSQAEEHFGQSLVHTVIETDRLLGFPPERAGPLQKTAPTGTDAIIGLPLRWNPDMLPDALIVYVVGQPHISHFGEQQVAALIESWQADLDNLVARLGDLDEMAMLAERLREAETFATM